MRSAPKVHDRGCPNSVLLALLLLESSSNQIMVHLSLGPNIYAIIIFFHTKDQGYTSHGQYAAAKKLRVCWSQTHPLIYCDAAVDHSKLSSFNIAEERDFHSMLWSMKGKQCGF
jgi:hypothetical protein